MSSNKQYYRHTSYEDVADENDNRIRVTRWWCIETYHDEEHRIEETTLEFTIKMQSDRPWDIDPEQDNKDLPIGRELFLEEYIEFSLEITNHYVE